MTFEESPQQLIAGALSLGLDLQPFISAGRLHLMQVSPMELDVDEHIYEMQKLVRNCGTKRLVIDSISSFELGMQDKSKYTDYLWAMADFFKTQGINLLLTHEVHDSAKITTLTKHGISFIADNIVLLFFMEQGLEMKRCLRVIKMRSSGHQTSVRELRVHQDGLSLEQL